MPNLAREYCRVNHIAQRTYHITPMGDREVRNPLVPFILTAIVPYYGSVLVSWCAKNRHILTAPEEL